MDAIDLLAAHLLRREMAEPGQQSRLAKHLNVTPGLVHQWLRRIRPIAPTHSRGIEEYTGGEVSRFIVAPKVFGPPPETSAPLSEIFEQLNDVLTPGEYAELMQMIERGPEAAMGFVRGLCQKHQIPWTDSLIEAGVTSPPLGDGPHDMSRLDDAPQQ